MFIANLRKSKVVFADSDSTDFHVESAVQCIEISSFVHGKYLFM